MYRIRYSVFCAGSRIFADFQKSLIFDGGNPRVLLEVRNSRISGSDMKCGKICIFIFRSKTKWGKLSIIDMVKIWLFIILEIREKFWVFITEKLFWNSESLGYPKEIFPSMRTWKFKNSRVSDCECWISEFFWKSRTFECPTLKNYSYIHLEIQEILGFPKELQHQKSETLAFPELRSKIEEYNNLPLEMRESPQPSCNGSVSSICTSIFEN